MKALREPQVLAIIPARAGSKGIPGKNLRRVAGRSLLDLSIRAARNSRHRPRVVVSTDGDEIAAEARRCGAEVVLRPAGISGDTARSEDALLHVLKSLEDAEGYRPNLLVFLQCTSPLTASEDIDGTIDALIHENADTAVAVVPFHYFLWRRGANGDAEGINHDKHVRPMRQEREDQFLEAGAVYVMKAAPFREARHRFFGRTALHVMPAERRWEIDDPVDLHIAETMMVHRQPPVWSLPNPPSAVIFDFDGVMTDDRVLVSDEGHESVVCHRGDGFGLERLRKASIPLLLLSKETNPVVSHRAGKLRIEVQQGIESKATALRTWAARTGIDLTRAIYVGNDLNDLEALATVGWPIAVANAHPQVRQAARLVLQREGGSGAVRELCEILMGPRLDRHS